VNGTSVYGIVLLPLLLEQNNAQSSIGRTLADIQKEPLFHCCRIIAYVARKERSRHFTP
jgi:hypothetical protein